MILFFVSMQLFTLQGQVMHQYLKLMLRSLCPGRVYKLPYRLAAVVTFVLYTNQQLVHTNQLTVVFCFVFFSFSPKFKKEESLILYYT